jgi:hypothetical protein
MTRSRRALVRKAHKTLARKARKAEPRDTLGRPLSRRYATVRPGGPKVVDEDSEGNPILENDSPFGYRLLCKRARADAKREVAVVKPRSLRGHPPVKPAIES